MQTQNKRIKVFIYAVAFTLITCVAYVWGAYSYSNNIFPVNVVRDLSREPGVARLFGGVYDHHSRLIEYRGKTQVPCPVQDSTTGVILAIGQSNSANHAEKRMTTKYPAQVLNYYDGKCFVASSPLLGATGEEGEFLTPLADKLIDGQIYTKVILISSGIGGTPISRWQEDGDLNGMLLDTLRGNATYTITDVIWHQGESDYGNKTSSKVYERSFLSLKESLQRVGVNGPYFMAITTRCGHDPRWSAQNPVAQAIKSLSTLPGVYVAVNSDNLLSDEDRRDDACHLSVTGQWKTADAYARVFRRVHQKK